MSDIKTIMDKYNVGETDAIVILSVAMETGKPVDKLVSTFKMLKNSGKMHGEPEEQSYKLSRAATAHAASALYLSRPLITGVDDLSTKRIFPLNSRIELDAKGKRVGNVTHGVSTRNLLRVLDEEKNKVSEYKILPHEIPPRYYYLAMNYKKPEVDKPEDKSMKLGQVTLKVGKSKIDPMQLFKFYDRGYYEPPTFDDQFEGYGKRIPYAKVVVTKIRYASGLPKPVYNDNFEGEPQFKKVNGTKDMTMTLYFHGHAPIVDETTLKNVPYSHNSEDNIATGKGIIASRIHDALIRLYTNNKEIRDVYGYINDKHFGHTPKEIAEFEHDKQFQTYYPGFHPSRYKESSTDKNDEMPSLNTLELRKKKILAKKLKRKVIAAKTPVKKKIKKCTCTPTQKRKLVTIKKKLTHKVKRK
jgi:hypothetical protein